jgi:outer membrane beta-barrel protein
MRRNLASLLCLVVLFAGYKPVHADDKTTPPKSPAAPTVSGGDSSAAEEVDVEKIKKKYWARGDETETGVVQNRLYPKNHRFELGVTGASLSGDPFLTSYTLGATLGFHFSEFLSIHAVYWNAFVSPSSALTTLQNTLGTTTNTNEPRNYVGGEARASLLYGKLSLLGAAILYFDAYFSLGAGRILTESGPDFLVSAGIGQQIHLSKMWALNIDYKLLRYDETILGKVPGTNLGQNLATRANLSSAVTLGVSLFVDFFGDK